MPFRILPLIFCLFLSAGASAQLLLDWEADGSGEPLPAGSWITEQYASIGLHISALNYTGPDKAIIFDSANPTGGDLDLETPGYHPSNTKPYFNILILAENDIDGNGDGLIDDPDDEGSRPAGYIDFAFDFHASDGYAVLIDTEESGGTIEFFREADMVHSLPIPATADNAVQTVSWEGFEYDLMRINLAGSAGIGEVNVVPEPATAVILGLGLLCAAVRRRL